MTQFFTVSSRGALQLAVSPAGVENGRGKWVKEPCKFREVNCSKHFSLILDWKKEVKFTKL